MTGSDSRDRWLDQQLELRRQEFELSRQEFELRLQEVSAAVEATKATVSAAGMQRKTVRLQFIAVAAGLLASCAAAFAAYQAGAAVRASGQATTEQAADSQLSTAISAIGGSTPAERVAGMTLLDLNAHSRIAAASNELSRQDAFGEYVTAVDVLVNYIRDDETAGTASTPQASPTASPVASPAASPAASFGPGYGVPPGGQSEPFDVLYAAAELRDLLSMRIQVESLHPAEGVGVDLSGDELSGLSWADVQLGWVDAYLPKIDLRGANLSGSSWAHADLAGAFLQCADLSGADFAGADLKDADLPGADVEGANFAGAHLHGAHLSNVFGRAAGLRHELPVTSFDSDPLTCEANHAYWAVPAAGTVLAHPAATPRATSR